VKRNFEIIDGVTSADVAFRAYGGTLTELFLSSAMALMSIMLENPEGIDFSLSRDIELINEDRELLLFEFLNEFIFYKDSELLLLKPESVEIEEKHGGYRLQCDARGEYVDRNRHIFNVDIKAVTMHGLSIDRDGGQWCAMVVLDV
jgi:SHS2 domain-containing protein